jgi:hypothetical protein
VSHWCLAREGFLRIDLSIFIEGGGKGARRRRKKSEDT